MSVGETAISNIETYNKCMSKSFIDKAFFMDKLNDKITTILDYGCADGTLICALASMYPNMTFIGYDIDEAMINLAKEKSKELSNIFLFSNLELMQTWITENYNYENIALNMSSLIHEIYSYCSEAEITNFWKFVTQSGFGCIITRDMCLDNYAHRPSLKEDVLKIHSKYPADKIAEFEKYHGSISDNYNLIHFLMKYNYKENWDREVKENYLPYYPTDMVDHIGNNYSIVYFDHYILPYLARKAKEDFDITIKDYTHIKFIFEKK